MTNRKASPITSDSIHMTFMDHLRELRRRILVSALGIIAGSIVAFIFFNYIIEFLFMPFEMIESLTTDEQLFITTLFEGFLTKLKISLLTGIIISFPVHLYNLVRFIFPGLRIKEKRVIVVGLFVS